MRIELILQSTRFKAQLLRIYSAKGIVPNPLRVVAKSVKAVSRLSLFRGLPDTQEYDRDEWSNPS